MFILEKRLKISFFLAQVLAKKVKSNMTVL